MFKQELESNQSNNLLDFVRVSSIQYPIFLKNILISIKN